MRSIVPRSVLVAGIMFAGLGNPAQSSAPSIREVPFRMDASNQAGWWHPIDELGGVVTTAYNGWGGPQTSNGGPSDTHAVYVARREPGGTWERGCLRAGVNDTLSGIQAGPPHVILPNQCAIYEDDVGHSQPTVVVDGDGTIHTFSSMHNVNWRYHRSASPGDVTKMIDRSLEMPDQGDLFTYPMATRVSNGDIYLIVRAYPEGRLYRWDNTLDLWTRVAVFAAQSGFVVYPNDIVEGRQGRLSILWEWGRGGRNGGATALRHLGSLLQYNTSSGGFSGVRGTRVTVPATTKSRGAVYRPLGRGESLNDRESAAQPQGVQSAKVVVDGTTGRPLIAYRDRPAPRAAWRVRLATWTGKRWQRQTVYGGAYSTRAALDVSISRDGKTARVYYVKRGVSGRNHAFVAHRRSRARWIEAPLLPGARIERLSVIPRDGKDYVYLASPGARRLHVGTLAW